MFGMDRMLAIFYVIAEMQTNINADVLSQVSTLVSLGLLAQVQLLILYITTNRDEQYQNFYPMPIILGIFLIVPIPRVFVDVLTIPIPMLAKAP